MNWTRDTTSAANRWLLDIAPAYVYKLYYWVSPNPRSEPSGWSLKGCTWAFCDSDDPDTPPLAWANDQVRRSVRDKALRDMAEAEEKLAAARKALAKII